MSLASCLVRLDDAIEAASALGLDTGRAALVRETARQRLGFLGDAYVLALAGGTGVGKSSLLNALAGTEVSRAAARRPTTSEPIAWVPRASRSELAPLLDWLGVREVREHDDGRAPEVAILDLPDLDSIEPEHRARVDELLPKVDAVAWVSDPEKYQDAVLHDDYLVRWMPRLPRQLLILNKMDRVEARDGDRLREDLSSRLHARGMPQVPIVLASAAEGDHGVADVKRWIAGGVDAKRVIAARLAAEAGAETRDLAERGGVATTDGPLVAPDRRARALRDVIRESLAIVDLRGFERQGVAATRLAARPRGAGPLGHLTSAVYRWSGRERAAADPAGFLRRWRERGSLARPAEPVRALAAEVLAAIPPAARPPFAALGEPGALQTSVGRAIDATVSAQANGLTVPRRAVWTLIGLGQYAVIGLLIFSGLWFALLLFAGAAVGVAEIPLLGPIPTPLLLLAATLLLGYVLARLLGAHAGWTGRRWARGLGASIAGELQQRLGTELFAPLDALEAARERLRVATRGAERACASVDAAD